MQDSNWELVNGPAAHEIEYINYTNQINVIEALVILFTNSAEPNGIPSPGRRVLNELHRTGPLFLLQAPGEFREEHNVCVSHPDGTIVYEAPPWEQVKDLVAVFHSDLQEMWNTSDPISIAAFALWKLCWIHPFKNGNGRTARAFSYACLCLKVGFFLPGAPTVIDQIMADRDRYQHALRHADVTFANAGTPDLGPMQEYLADLLSKQLASLTPNDAGEQAVEVPE